MSHLMLSPVPGIQRWLTQQLAEEDNPDAALLPRLARDGWWHDPKQSRCAQPQFNAPWCRLF